MHQWIHESMQKQKWFKQHINEYMNQYIDDDGLENR